MLRSVTVTILVCVVAFYAQRRIVDTDVGLQERMDAMQFLQATVAPAMMEKPDDEREVWELRLKRLGMVAKDQALLSRYPKYKSRLERLVRVYRAHTFVPSGGSTAREVEAATVPSDEHSFTHAEFPGYTDPDTSVLRMVDNKQTLVQRRQLSGLCYMHAPAVVQYYAIWHTALKAGNATAWHGMLDLTYDIATKFSPLRLAGHVLADEGDSSLDYLYGILQPESKIKPLWLEGDHRSHLREYGPGLVAGFKVYSDFLDKNVRHHYQPQAGNEYEGRHAMVLVGARVDSNGNHFYLLQNWWQGKQFVEVSQEYLAFCKAAVYYVVTPQTGVPTDRHTHAAGMHFAETEAVLEQAERLPMEMVRSPLHPARPDQFV